MSRKKFMLFALFILCVTATTTVLADQKNSEMLIGNNHEVSKEIYDKIYSETPFIRDPNKEVTMIQPESRAEALEIHEKIYAETPFIKEAEEGLGYEVDPSVLSLPYYFNFEFDAALTSTAQTNAVNGGTIRITANGDWKNKPDDLANTEFAYYDITLYANGENQGTSRFNFGSWQHADWTNVPSGNVIFYMSKPQISWNNMYEPGYMGTISGSGQILNQ